jgi:hypothetical protein
MDTEGVKSGSCSAEKGKWNGLASLQLARFPFKEGIRRRVIRCCVHLQARIVLLTFLDDLFYGSHISN